LLKIYIKENVNDTQYNVSRQKGLKALTAALKKMKINLNHKNVWHSFSTAELLKLPKVVTGN